MMSLHVCRCSHQWHMIEADSTLARPPNVTTIQLRHATNSAIDAQWQAYLHQNVNGILQNWSWSPKLRELIIQVEVIVRVHILCSPSQLRDTRKSSTDLCPCKIYISYRPKLDQLGICQSTFRLQFLSPQFCCQLALHGLDIISS